MFYAQHIKSKVDCCWTQVLGARFGHQTRKEMLLFKDAINIYGKTAKTSKTASVLNQIETNKVFFKNLVCFDQHFCLYGVRYRL